MNCVRPVLHQTEIEVQTRQIQLLEVTSGGEVIHASVEVKQKQHAMIAGPGQTDIPFAHTPNMQ